MNIFEAAEIAKEKAFIRPQTDGRLSGKITIITGGAQGFGLGIAKEMYCQGASLVLADLPVQAVAGEEAAKSLGERAIFLPVDVTDESSVEAIVCATVEHFGGLDIMVANAGVVKAGPLDNFEKKDLDFVTAVNYTGYFLCAKYASIVMKAQYEANPDLFSDIIQINSKSGLTGSKNNFAYAGSKFGGIGLTQSFALELAPWQIKVNSICPGNFYDGPLWSDPDKGLFVQYLKAGKVPGAKTVEDVKNYYLSLAPIKRGCTPKDVSKALFYCVEQEYETGQALPVTGGQIMMN